MEWNAIKDEFAIRLYRFAVEDFDRELSADFPILRSIQGTEAMKIVDIFASLSIGVKRETANALLRRCHPRAVEILGQSGGERDKEHLRRFEEIRLQLGAQWKYLSRSEKLDFSRLFQMQNRPLPPEAFGDPDLSEPDSEKLRKREFRKLLMVEMHRVFGHEAINCGAGEWCFAIECEKWTVSTDIDLGGRSYAMRYSHDITWPNGPVLARSLSVGGWLGLGDIGWDLLTERNSEEAIQTLSALCKRFMGIAPTLLENLQLS